MRYKITKETVRTVLRMWDTKTIDQIADGLGCSKPTIQRIASIIRKSGYQLSRKRKNGDTDHLVKEVLREDGLI